MCGQFTFNTHSLMGRGKSFQQTTGTAVSTQTEWAWSEGKAEAAEPSGKVERSLTWGRRALRTRRTHSSYKDKVTDLFTLNYFRVLEILKALGWQRILAVHVADGDLFQHMGNSITRTVVAGCLQRSSLYSQLSTDKDSSPCSHRGRCGKLGVPPPSFTSWTVVSLR